MRDCDEMKKKCRICQIGLKTGRKEVQEAACAWKKL
jgi:hypothetical protein